MFFCPFKFFCLSSGDSLFVSACFMEEYKKLLMWKSQKFIYDFFLGEQSEWEFESKIHENPFLIGFCYYVMFTIKVIFSHKSAEKRSLKEYHWSEFFLSNHETPMFPPSLNIRIDFFLMIFAFSIDGVPLDVINLRGANFQPKHLSY